MIDNTIRPSTNRPRRTPWDGDALSVAKTIDDLLGHHPRIKPPIR